ncbi:heparinase II/III domain-containing protein [Parvularcula oceani]|uniref:heparinase II/III domain-containing protein n=1 Tax=Parvularcula oceani TaxID=1247963 RepID=UPI0004E1918A|nr:heparinase II/III family protein [Parvularcula oceani]
MMPPGSSRHRFYHDVSLRGPVPDRILTAPDELRGPSPALARKLITEAEHDPGGFFSREAPSFAYAQSFGWLAPLRHAEGGAEAALRLYDAWAKAHGRYAPKAWAPPLAAARTEAILRHADLLLTGRDAPHREQVLSTLIRQTRHLARTVRGKPPGEQRLSVLIGLAMGALCLPFASDQERIVKPQLAAALSAMANGVLPPRLREPEAAITLGLSLAGLQQVYRRRGLTPPSGLAPALAVVRLMLGGLRVGDGGLAVLPGGTEGDAVAIEALDPMIRPEAEQLLERLGYVSARAGTTALHADLGRLSGDGSGAAAFTLCDGADRLVTCAGAPESALGVLDRTMAEWREALSVPAASATLDAGKLGPARLDREDSRAGTLLTLDRRGGGGRHRRRLFLDRDGTGLRGEDQAQLGEQAVFRFPLAPSVEARRSADEKVTLVLPSGRSWRFETAAAELTVEEGIYSGGRPPARSQQLVLRPQHEGVRWAFKRV